MTDRPDETGQNTAPERPNRRWRLPPRLFGRARTSTVILGICFVLTGLLYNQLESENSALQQGPMPVDLSLFEEPAQQSGASSETTETTTQAPTATSTPPSISATITATTTVTTPVPNVEPTTQDPTFLPGRTIPPELRSLIPPAPGTPSAVPTQ